MRIDHDDGRGWTWEIGTHELTMRQTGRFDARGQSILAYMLTMDGRFVFVDEDFAGSPMHADDSPQTMLALIGFLTLCPGDTDREYFDNYSPEQFHWCREHAEALRVAAQVTAIDHALPLVEEIVEELNGILEDAEQTDPAVAAEGFDVRLQVLPDGCWGLKWGDPGFDLDHNGHWGAATLATGDNLTEIAKDLRDQVADSMYQEVL